MQLRRPFVYVASLRRTGSTMLAQLLSRPPEAYVFREPRLGLGRLRVKPEVAPIFAPFGGDVLALKREMRELPRAAALARFAEFASAMAPHVEQLGIKEITHGGHEDVARLFPDLRVIVTVRDPRDIYLSLYQRRKELLSRGRLWFETATLLPYLREQFANLVQIMERHPHLVVRYEDLCRDPAVLERAREFVASPVRDVGLLAAGADRRDLAKHRGAIDPSRVALHARETDEIARHNARYVFEEMGDYAERFGYA